MAEKEYIEREKALDFISEVEPIICMPPDNKPTFTAVKDADMVAFIESIPAADVRPVVRAHWIKAKGSWCTPGGDPVWECSECGKGLHVYGIEHGSYGADVADGQWVACPNCGADMRPTSMSGANGEES